MSESQKDRIISDLQQAKQEGQLRTEKIREIVRAAAVDAVLELKVGSGEIRSLVRDAVSAVIETLKERGGEIKEEVTASVEGAIEGVTSARRQALSKEQVEVQQLQGKIEDEELKLQKDIDESLSDLEQTKQDQPEKIKAAIESAINNLKDTEEVAVLQKRYAQLKAQLAIVQANLASRYGERYEDVKHYLDEAKTWYDKAKEDPEVFTDRVKERRVEFEQKLGDTGVAIARKERQTKQLLKELWLSITEIFRDRQDKDKI